MAPEWSGSFNLDHVYPLGNNYTLTSQLSVPFTSDYHSRVNLDPRGRQEGYWKLDARVALSKDNWEFAVIGKNLTDEDTFSVIQQAAPGTSSFQDIRNRQRYVLLQGKYAW